MRDCVADGYTSFKIFMIGFAEFDKYAAEYLRCMEEAGKLGAMVNIHCEDQCCISYMTQKLEEENNSNVRTFPDSRPRISEGLAARRALWMAHVADVPAYLVHLSCQEGLDALNDARGRGQTCYGETRPIYLHLSRERFNEEVDPERYVGWPPLREADQMEVMWQALDSNVLQTVATDHVGWNMKQKKASVTVDELLPGMSNLETVLPMLYSEGVREGRLSAPPLCGCERHPAGQAHGHVPAEGDHRGGLRRRRHGLRPRQARHHPPARHALQAGLGAARGLRGHRLADHDHLARRHHRGERQGQRGARPRQAGQAAHLYLLTGGSACPIPPML